MIDLLARLIPLFPLLACLTTLGLGPRVLREKSHWPTIVGCALSAVCSLVLVFAVRGSQNGPADARTVVIYQWMNIDSAGPATGGQGAKLPTPGSIIPPPLDIQIAFRVDSLSATMLAM